MVASLRTDDLPPESQFYCADPEKDTIRIWAPDLMRGDTGKMPAVFPIRNPLREDTARMPIIQPRWWSNSLSRISEWFTSLYGVFTTFWVFLQWTLAYIAGRVIHLPMDTHPTEMLKTFIALDALATLTLMLILAERFKPKVYTIMVCALALFSFTWLFALIYQIAGLFITIRP